MHAHIEMRQGGQSTLGSTWLLGQLVRAVQGQLCKASTHPEPFHYKEAGNPNVFAWLMGMFV